MCCVRPSRRGQTAAPQDEVDRRIAEKKFSFGFKLMLPVQTRSQKYSGSLFTQITCISLAIPARTKGRFAIVTDVGQGCDGRGGAKDEWR